MFSSTSLIPFLPHLISSFSSNTSPLVTDTNRFSFPPKNSTNDPHLFDSLNSMAPPPAAHAMVTNYVDQHNPSASFSTFLNQSRKTGSKPVKKDRHSKIRTAQGLRDRRVRLSIGIARKFFDLQDMLGFVKASETLEWLLNKSKKAIKEVREVSTNNNNNNNGSCITTIATSSTCEVVSQSGDMFPKSDRQKKLRRSSPLNVSVHMAKESRAKARARARERTRVKMYTKRSLRSDVLDQNNQTCEKLKLATYEHQLEVPNKGTSVTEESSFMVIKRKLKPNNGIVGTYHQNHVMLKDVSCINSNNSINLMNSPQNWDFSSAIARSSFCAITNINPSTGLHLCRKLSEAESYYCPN